MASSVPDHLDLELIINSVIHSFEKVQELTRNLNEHKVEWKREVTLNFINKCMGLNASLFEKVNPAGQLTQKALADLQEKKKKMVEGIRKSLG